MSITYKTDDSFFTIVVPVGSVYSFWSIFKWFIEDPFAKFRAIRDYEAENQKFTLTEIDDYYPGIKTIGVVMNPWSRAVYNYHDIISRPEEYKERVRALYPTVDIGTFSKFVTSMSKSPMLPQSHWLMNKTQSVDFLLKAESINEDFKPIQEYFCSTVPLEIEDYNIDYQSYYTAETKKIISTLFAKDIENFGYVF